MIAMLVFRNALPMDIARTILGAIQFRLLGQITDFWPICCPRLARIVFVQTSINAQTGRLTGTIGPSTPIFAFRVKDRWNIVEHLLAAAN